MASLALSSATAQRPAWVDPPSIGLFLLMSAYGPSFNTLGEFRYVEMAVLGIVVFSLRQVWGTLSGWDKRLAALFILTALAQLVSDYANGSDPDASAKRVGTYLILAPLLFGVKYLSANRAMRLRWLLFGYANSYVLAALTGIGRSESFQLNPWRLGLGFGLTLAAAAALSLDKRFQRLAPIVLLAFAAFDLLSEARSEAVVALATAAVSLWAIMRGNMVPSKFAGGRTIASIAAGLLGIVAIYQSSYLATQAGILPTELQKKMEQQFASRYGILAAGRPDTVAAAYAVTKRPVIGYGASSSDYDVLSYYNDLAVSAYADQANFLTLYYLQSVNTDLSTLPNHSHLLGAWVEAGILGAVCWFAILWLCLQVGVRCASWRHPLTPLFAFVAISTFWTVLFSPGPHRMEIAIRICVLTYALALMARTRAAALDRAGKNISS